MWLMIPSLWLIKDEEAAGNLYGRLSGRSRAERCRAGLGRARGDEAGQDTKAGQHEAGQDRARAGQGRAKAEQGQGRAMSSRTRYQVLKTCS